MASTYSSRLRLELMASGEQSGSWGTKTNTNLGTLIEEAIAGYESIATGDANVTLTTSNGATDQARKAMLKFTGTLTATRNIIVPSVSKLYLIHNACTGYSLYIKTSAGNGVYIQPDQKSLVYCDGTDVLTGVYGNQEKLSRRQTVLSGAKDSSGFPAFFAAGSGLRLSLDATPTNLRIAFADGANGDIITTLTADAADMLGADVPASTRAYIYATYASAAAVTWNYARKAPQYGTNLDRAALGSILHFEGADASTSIIDDYGNTWTASGNAQIDTAQSSVGSSSLLLDGTGDYITTTDIAVIGDPSTGAFTIRGRVRFNALPTSTNYTTIVAAVNGGNYGMILFVYNNAGTYQTAFYLSSTGASHDIANNLKDDITVATGAWYDFAIVYDDVSGHYRLYWNGVQVRAISSTAKICAITTLRYGTSASLSWYLNGWLDECVYEPYCLYPAGTTFTPPTTAFAVNGHWYDIDSGTMYEVTSASVSAGVNPGLTARQRVFVGEAIAGASSISSVVNYAYQGRYDSGLFAVAAVTTYTKSHNLGTFAKNIQVNMALDAAGRNEWEAVDFMYDNAVTTYVGYKHVASDRNSISPRTTTAVGHNAAGTPITSAFYRILADRGF